jgi:hypothetical protein
MLFTAFLLATAVLANQDVAVLEADFEAHVADNATLDKRQFASFSAAVIEITFYSFIDSTTNFDGDCAQNCAANPSGPFESNQGTVAHTCTNPDGSARTNSAGFPTPGGDGTFNNPISAAATGEAVVGVCQPFWSPYLFKWFIYDDVCPSCTDTPSHFDLFIGGSASDTECPGICDCENALTPTNGGNFGVQGGGGAAYVPVPLAQLCSSTTNKFRCIFYDFSATDSSALFPYQPVETGALFSGGNCYPTSDLNTVDSSSGDGSLCEVCLVTQDTCKAGDSAAIPNPVRKRKANLDKAVTARAVLPKKTAAPKL